MGKINEYNQENTYLRTTPTGIERYCRACRRMGMRLKRAFIVEKKVSA